MRCFLLSASFLLSIICSGQKEYLQKIRSYREKNEVSIFNDFISFLKIPNVATDSLNIRKNADFLAEFMRSKGVSNVQLLNAAEKKIPPVVYGEIKVPGSGKTVIFYAHYDGQPVNPAMWARGLHPFQPQIVSGRIDENGRLEAGPVFPLPPDWRIYGRGASDDKAGVMAIITAFAAVRESGFKFPYNVKFFFEGEEEDGSTHLHQILEKYRPLLKSDLWIICDGPIHQSGNKQIVFGARGDAHLTLKVYGPKNPLHSGHYGNWVPNPVMLLSQLLSSMKDENGIVRIKDFYSDVIPLSSTEKQAIASLPDVDKELKKKIGFTAEEMTGKNLMESINLPSLNINGMESSNVGTIQANVIPTSATAVIDLRLVLGNDWKRQQQKVIDHILSQGFYITESEPNDDERSRYKKIIKITRDIGENAQRTSMDWSVAKAVLAAVQQTTREPVLEVPSSGGTLPLQAVTDVLGTKFLIVPLANPDNNQHAENENIRIQNLWDGIETMAAIMLMKF